MTAREQRWQTSLHESAHLTIARALNTWDCSCMASVLPGGGGLCQLPEGLSKRSVAISIAASTYSAPLAERHPIPRMPRRKPSAAPSVDESTGRKIVEVQAEDFDALPERNTDAELVAAYCVHRYESEGWTTWKERFEDVHGEARRLVEKHEAKIVATATHIFRFGGILIQGDPEHDKLFRKDAE